MALARRILTCKWDMEGHERRRRRVDSADGEGRGGGEEERKGGREEGVRRGVEGEEPRPAALPPLLEQPGTRWAWAASAPHLPAPGCCPGSTRDFSHCASLGPPRGAMLGGLCPGACGAGGAGHRDTSQTTGARSRGAHPRRRDPGSWEPAVAPSEPETPGEFCELVPGVPGPAGTQDPDSGLAGQRGIASTWGSRGQVPAGSWARRGGSGAGEEAVTPRPPPRGQARRLLRVAP